jgi:uncharacterized protein (TIGR03435 family)
MQKLRDTFAIQRTRMPNPARFLAVVAIAFIFAFALQTRAQSQPPTEKKPSFDVASVKPNKTDGPANLNIPLLGDIYTPTGGVFSGTNIRLATYIYFAYDLTGNQLQHLIPQLPNWVVTDRFDIEARAEGDPPKSQIRLMVQSLLEDRFKLVAHYDTEQLPVFAAALSKAGKTGPQLQPHSNATPCSTVPPSPAAPGSAPAKATIAGGLPIVCGGIVGLAEGPGGRMRVGGRNLPIGMIVAALAQMGNLDRPVVDQTGLTGTFDFTFEWTPQHNGIPQPDAVVPPDDSGPTFMDDLRLQLGLKLDSQKGPVKFLVVDHIERPSPN